VNSINRTGRMRNIKHCFGQLEDTDYATFKTQSDARCVAKDKKGYWFWNERKSRHDLNDEERQMVENLEK
jgi:hypothetical protein